MGIPVLIMGESGSGKSASMRNFEADDLLIFNVASKPLPFRKKLNSIKKATYNVIAKELSKKQYKRYVIDDSQYLLAFDSFNRAKETGYAKFTDMAVRFQKMITFIIVGLPDDTIVYFLHHCEQTENGKIKAKTIGKMLDNQLTVEGLFSIVLLCQADGQSHSFITQSDGHTTCKSPMDMFDLEIDNDLKAVDERIREYYGLNEEDKNNE